VADASVATGGAPNASAGKVVRVVDPSGFTSTVNVLPNESVVSKGIVPKLSSNIPKPKVLPDDVPSGDVTAGPSNDSRN